MTTGSVSDSYLGDATTTATLLWTQLTRETRRLCAGEHPRQDGSPGGLDALDGSALFDTVTYGHGATAGLYRAGHGGAVELLYTVTVNSTGLALVYLARHDAVFVGSAGAEGTFRRITATDLWPVENIRHDVVACVAASPRHRELVAPLFATDVDWPLPGRETPPHAGLTVVTTGGAPAAIGLVVARLAALVLPNPQTLHDAAPMLALAALEIPTFDERGIPVSYPALKAQFHELARPDAGHAAYHPVPRLVFSRRPELGRLLAERIFGRAEDDRRATGDVSVRSRTRRPAVLRSRPSADAAAKP